MTNWMNEGMDEWMNEWMRHKLNEWSFDLFYQNKLNSCNISFHVSLQNSFISDFVDDSIIHNAESFQLITWPSRKTRKSGNCNNILQVFGNKLRTLAKSWLTVGWWMRFSEWTVRDRLEQRLLSSNDWWISNEKHWLTYWLVLLDWFCIAALSVFTGVVIRVLGCQSIAREFVPGQGSVPDFFSPASSCKRCSNEHTCRPNNLGEERKRPGIYYLQSYAEAKKMKLPNFFSPASPCKLCSNEHTCRLHTLGGKRKRPGREFTTYNHIPRLRKWSRTDLQRLEWICIAGD